MLFSHEENQNWSPQNFPLWHKTFFSWRTTYVLSLKYAIKKNNTNECICKTQTDWDTENKLVTCGYQWGEKGEGKKKKKSFLIWSLLQVSILLWIMCKNLTKCVSSSLVYLSLSNFYSDQAKPKSLRELRKTFFLPYSHKGLLLNLVQGNTKVKPNANEGDTFLQGS